MLIAAGGILERQTAAGPKIALVYRDRHGPEWSLPKGKVEPGESLEDAALREVTEETNCTGTLKSYVGVTDYLVDDSPKIVLFWHMVLETENPFQPSNETKKLIWLSPKKAIRQLTHKNQRDLLHKAYSIKQIAKNGGIMPRFRWRGKRWKRLASSIQSYRGEIPCLEKLNPTNSNCTNCFETIKKLLDEALEQLEEGNIDTGWKLFHAARRMEVISLCEDDQRRTKARDMLQEALKINGWRGEAIKRLVEFEEKPPSVEALYQAALTRDEYFSNNAYKGALLRTQAITLALILFTDLLLLFLCLIFIPGLLPQLIGFCEESSTIYAEPYQILITVGLFGILGGTVSAITSVPKSLETARIPELTTSFTVIFLRLSMGFASAIVIIVLLHSDLAGKLFTGVLTKDLAEVIQKADPYTSYFIAFCVGFSERLVKRAVEYVAGS